MPLLPPAAVVVVEVEGPAEGSAEAAGQHPQLLAMQAQGGAATAPVPRGTDSTTAADGKANPRTARGTSCC